MERLLKQGQDFLDQQKKMEVVSRVWCGVRAARDS